MEQQNTAVSAEEIAAAEEEVRRAQARLAELKQRAAQHATGSVADPKEGAATQQGSSNAAASSAGGAYGASASAGAGQAPQNSYAAASAAPQNPFAASQAAPQNPYAAAGAAPYNPYAAAGTTPQSPYGAPSYYGAAQPVKTSKDHVAAGLLAIFLGGFGIHKFYLGYNTPGFIMLAIAIIGGVLSLGIATLGVWVVALIEGIMYLSKTQSEFDATYVLSSKEWF